MPPHSSKLQVAEGLIWGRMEERGGLVLTSEPEKREGSDHLSFHPDLHVLRRLPCLGERSHVSSLCMNALLLCRSLDTSLQHVSCG